MLRQIISRIGATIRTEGVFKLDNTRRVDWLTVETPPKEGTKGLVEVESFHSVPCMTDYEAEENVSELAIGHFVSQMSICVNNINYAPLLETCRQLSYSMCWAQVIQARCETLRLERDGLLNAYMDLLNRLSSICVSYSDILPLASWRPINASSTYIEPILYTGARPTQTRLELLAKELFNILQENTPDGNPIID